MQPIFPSQGVKPRQGLGSPGPKSIFPPAAPLGKPATGSPKRAEPKIEHLQPKIEPGGSSATRAQELAARIQQASINRASSVKKVKDLAAKLVVHAERQEEIRTRTMKKLEDVSQKLNREQPGAPGALSTSQTTKEQADARQPQSGGSAQDPASGVERAKSLASRLIEQVERQDTMCSKALSRLEEYADKLKQPLPTVRPVSVPATAAAAAAPLPDGAASVHGLGASGTVGVHAVPSTSGGPLPLGTMTVDVQAAVRARMAEHSDPVPATAALAQEIHAQAAARLAAAAALRRLPLGVSLPSQPGLGVGAVGGTAAAAPQQPGSPAAGAAPAAAMSNVVPAPSATAPQHHEQPPAAAAAETQAQGAAQAQASQPQQGAALDTAPGAVEAAYAPGVARA